MNPLTRNSQPATRNSFTQPLIESLEARQLLSASALASEGGHFSRNRRLRLARSIHPVTGIAVDTAPGKLLNVPATIKNATVQIDWGDGSPADTSNVGISQGFIIPTATHTYQHTGSFKTVVTFSTADRVLGAASQTVTVTDVSSGGLHVTAVTGTQFINVVGTISHLDPQRASGPLLPPDAVGVEWGDGSGSDPIGPITDYENGAFIASDSHQYSATGTYTITVTFLLNDHTDTTQNTVLASATTSLKVLP